MTYYNANYTSLSSEQKADKIFTDKLLFPGICW